MLDSCGDLILRIGKYGNVEDGKPLIADGGPSNTRSISGDEVSLFHAAYLATHADKRPSAIIGLMSRISKVIGSPCLRVLDVSATELQHFLAGPESHICIR